MAEECNPRALQRGTVEQRAQAMLNPWLESTQGFTSEEAPFIAGGPQSTCFTGVRQHSLPFTPPLYSHKDDTCLQNHDFYYPGPNPAQYPARQVFQPSPLHQATCFPTGHHPVFRSGDSSYGGAFQTSASFFPAAEMDFCQRGDISAEGHSVGKSQSMRALYEENAALRRALHSIKMTHNLLQQQRQTAGSALKSPTDSQERYIISDEVEGRTLSMRERGRWGVQVTPGGVPAAPPLLHCAHHQCVAVDGTAAWQHHSCCCFHSYDGVYDEEEELAACAPAGPRVKTLKEQMEAARRPSKGEQGGSQAHRRRRSTRRMPCSKEEGEGRANANQRCAMCGAALLQKQDHVACGGLPLLLCQACHPSADMAPCEAGHAAPRLTPGGRHRAAVAISLACKPDPASSNRKKPKTRIVDLCRHFVGLSTSSSTPP